MAVVQISKIQIRRGQKNTSSGLPQLASGELAWAIDTQELYIGNGAVSEGAPYVGNTKIITEQDNLLELVGSYQFAKNNPAIQTGPNANQPIVQNLQDVIDQFVTANNFGVVGDGITDDTAAIQRAIDQLYLNPAAYQTGVGASTDARTELLFGPGTFRISETIHLPSYVFITGSGSEHTTFLYDGDGLAFKFVNANSTIGEYTTSNMTQINQPKYAVLRDFSINCMSSLASGLELNAVTNSRFENINITGSYPWDSLNYILTNDISQAGLILQGGLKDAQNPTIATTERNVFNNISISNFAVCVRGESNISYNTFKNCEFYDSFYGIILSHNIGVSVGNVVDNSSFKYINREGVKIFSGTRNIISKNRFEDVGNDGGSNLNSKYSVIYFNQAGNQSVSNSFDRTTALAVSDFTHRYDPEVDGVVYFVNGEIQQTSLTPAASVAIDAIRIPVTTNGSYTITYKYNSIDEEYQFRKGVLHISVDVTNDNFEFVDEYDILSGPSPDDENLRFYGAIVPYQINGTTIRKDFVVRYLNNNASGGILTFVITALT